MTLSEELDIALRELTIKGIRYPDETYTRIKMVKTTLDGIEGQFLNKKKIDDYFRPDNPEDTEDFGEDE